jgi:hypothetical protein
MTTSNDVILKRIECLEAELADLKRQVSGPRPAAATTRGILKDVTIRDEEIEAVKGIWSRAADDEPV